MDYLQLAINDASEYLIGLENKKYPHKMTIIPKWSKTKIQNKKKMKWFGSFFNLTGNQYKNQLTTWSRRVKCRDDKKCIWCGSHYNLTAHHIWHKEWVPESSLDIDNGITLCWKCHRLQHNYDK
jgi:hypothetical protein